VATPAHSVVGASPLGARAINLAWWQRDARPGPGARPASPSPRNRQAPALRMTPEPGGGHQHGIADADVQRCLDAPADVSPHPNDDTRTSFRRGRLDVLAGSDGLVLRIGRPR
jgi:hypothetical protein